jgi:hypothetical protein
MSTSSPTRSSIERNLSISFGLILVLIGPGCDRHLERRALNLSLYFTCDTRGRLEPCGCFTGQFGGLTRLKTVLDDEPIEPALRLDVGDAISGREDYDLLEYRYLLRAFAAIKYDALNVGGREAQLSSAQLQQLRQESPVPLLSANLLDKATGKPIFAPYRVVERGGFRIGIIGVLAPPASGEELGEGVEVADMASAIVQQVAELRPKTDLLILLAFADETALTKLAQQFYELHVVLGGKVRQPAQELKRENRSLIYYVTNESRALGILRLQLLSGHSPQPMGNEIRLLHDKIPEAEAFRQLAREYRAAVRQAQLAVDNPTNTSSDMVPGVRAVAAYVGSQRCLNCHKAAGALWQQTGHARAFATLIERGADGDPKCIGCHTTGFGSFSGYRRSFGQSKLVDVGCESCHGPGSLHVRQREGDPSVNFLYRPLGAGDCQKCHYGEFSRPFHWEEFWPPIKHGKEPSTPAKGNSL